MPTHSPQKLSNNWILFNEKPPNNVRRFDLHTNRFIISIVKRENNSDVYYEVKDPSLCGESFKFILILICYDLSCDELCRTIDFVSSFFMAIIFYLRNQIDDLLKYQKYAELVYQFFNEPGIRQYMILPINKLNLEIHRKRIIYIKQSFTKESSTIRKKLEECNSFLKDSTLKIMTGLSSMIKMQTPQVLQKKQQLSIETQTQQQPPKLQSSIETQTLQLQIQQLSIETQTPQPQKKSSIETQTNENYHNLLKEVARLKASLQKTLEKSKKEEDIPFSLKDHERVMSDYRDICNRDIEKLSGQIERLKKLNRDLIDENKQKKIEQSHQSPRSPIEIGSILSLLPKENLVGPLCAWSMNNIIMAHCEKIRDGFCLSPSGFYEFWTECIIPKINESSPLILLQLLSEWKRLLIFCRSSDMNLDTFSKQINIVFSQYIQNHISKNYDYFVIPFFNILIKSSKNMIILVGLINTYFEGKNNSVIKDRTYQYLIDLLTIQNAENILKKIIRSPNIESLNMDPKDRLEANTITFGIQLSA
jgi:hypothetical protein